jgi:hypothetical protein
LHTRYLISANDKRDQVIELTSSWAAAVYIEFNNVWTAVVYTETVLKVPEQMKLT